MTNVKCPNCARDFGRRVSRSASLERFLSIFYVYPFKCQRCGYRFRSLQWGVRYVRVEEDRREYDRKPISCPVFFSADTISGQGTLVDVQPVTVDAAVVRSAHEGGVGVEFLQWRQSERERLQLFVQSLLIGQGV